MSAEMGAIVADGTTRFRVRSPRADALWLCLFADDGSETRLPMTRDEDGQHWLVQLDEDLTGQSYGYRADGEWNPDAGLWFDPAKLLVDPHATQLDRRFTPDQALTEFGADTAHLVPRAVIMREYEGYPKAAPLFERGGLVYEVNVRAFTIQHPDVPEELRGTVAAMAHPAVIAHLQKLGVTAVEFMPVIAWMDEPHLRPLGLVNAWGYNPIAPMALDPGLCPGGVRELRRTVQALHDAGIGVLLDLVFNHTGEGDGTGNVICLRGLDDTAYARSEDGVLLNDSGCGNTVDFGQDWIQELALDTMRHFVARCGIDGFRFDLAPIMARSPAFDPQAPIFAAMAQDEWLHDRVLIAEPWDIGPGGYQLGQFPATWLEWNDRFRDDVRKFWKGDAPISVLATRLAGSEDVFFDLHDAGPRTVNFLAAHDGFTLADTLAYAERHNEANGEDNRDGHADNNSWNCGVEGPTDDPGVLAERARTARAMLATLFASTGTIMLTAGDEFGRTQQGNNNAYCQDNAIGWVDWQGRDVALEDFVADLSAMRRAHLAHFAAPPGEHRWQHADGSDLSPEEWNDIATDVLCVAVAAGEGPTFTFGRHDRRAEIAWADRGAD
ncbi:glycogen debranching protein GlgX [Alteraurantiacibacter buctensis]|uniref:Glycogen debranching protein GlgX n=1 Tax=Alteraurantiacibacter buctensis TaxID=1503981 RepID=A0A844YVG9_9SPHN|nr:glycogen debranching protein GlgX [Alteraurantiacibacter buctensis]MXO71046.1 glycogen debranching protein GlgX [Alteraurantiacibacter buctensis]